METETPKTPEENPLANLHVQGFADIDLRHLLDPADDAFRHLVDPRPEGTA